MVSLPVAANSGGTGTFYSLVARLTAQYERDLEALQQENDRLKRESAASPARQGWPSDGSPGNKDIQNASLKVENQNLREELRKLKAMVAAAKEGGALREAARSETQASAVTVNSVAMGRAESKRHSTSPSPPLPPVQLPFLIPVMKELPGVPAEESKSLELVAVKTITEPHVVDVHDMPDNVSVVTATASMAVEAAATEDGMLVTPSRSMRGRGALKVRINGAYALKGIGAGSLGAATSHSVVVSMSVGSKCSNTSEQAGYPNPTWDRWQEYSFPDITDQDVLELEVLKTAPGQESQKVGSYSLPLSGMAPHFWSRHTEELMPLGAGQLEFETFWRPGRDTSQERNLTHFTTTPTEIVAKLVRSSREAKFDRARTGHAGGLASHKTATFTSEDKRRRHLQSLFNFDLVAEGGGNGNLISAGMLHEVIVNRGLNIGEERLEKVVSSLKGMSALRKASKSGTGTYSLPMQRLDAPTTQSGTGSTSTTASNAGKMWKRAKNQVSSLIEFDGFADIMLKRDLHLQLGTSQIEKDILDIQRVLLTKDVNEVIKHMVHVAMPTHRQEYKENSSASITLYLNIAVCACVIISIMALAASMDNSPDWIGWVIIEIVCAVVFIVEICIKIRISGTREFFRGQDWAWNWSDIIITSLAVADVVLSVWKAAAEFSSMGRFSLFLRTLRLFRMARLMKMLRLPLVSELANMLVGFVLGTPALFWVLTLLWAFVGMVGMLFRHVVGPEPGEETLRELCGDGDSIDTTIPACVGQEATLYGEEFCSTVPQCSFAVFRCMIGDCATKGGQSLTVHFSNGYGWKFQIIYFVGMIILIFGLFNVITAIFVESTLQGLKNNDVKQKNATLYKAKYVERKLKELVARIYEVLPESDSIDKKLALSEANFYEVLGDKVVVQILEDLDIDLGNNAGLFEALDADENGRVDLAELISMLMKLRGGLQKSDMIGPWVVLYSLRQEFQELQMMLMDQQETREHDQQEVKSVVSRLSHAGGNLR